ncbi:coiled-coil domain-containing protein 87 [Sardina pilchardus]|uniref:coiled-coil domain-containing protein 87 n=1 Tax=Sardina pilchardus TaxID=27697 RepID=UPI002E135577
METPEIRGKLSHCLPKKENMTVLRYPAGGMKERVQFAQQHGDILPMTQNQMVSYASDAQQRYQKMSLFFQYTSKEDSGEAQDATDSVLEGIGAIPSSLSELCFQMQQRIKTCAVPSLSPEDQEALESVMTSELGLIWQDLRVSRPDPTLTWSENRALRHKTFGEVLRLCEQLHLSYTHLQHSLRRRAVFTDAANRSRLAAQMASDCTSVLNVHSIRRDIAAGIKAERKAKAKARRSPKSREERKQMVLKLSKGKTWVSKQHKESVQKDIAEIKEKIGLISLEHVYDLMPNLLEKTVDFNRSRTEKTGPDEALPVVPTEDEAYDVSDGLFTRLKGCKSMPDLSRETLLDELEMDAPPPRPQSPLVLMVISKPVVQQQTLSMADDLNRLLQDDSSLDNTDPDVDIPPLIKARSYRSSAKLQRLQAVLQSLREKRERLTQSRVTLKRPEHPQAEVVSVPISSHATARLAAARVSDRVAPEKINVNMFPPVYDDVNRDIEASSVQWMDRNLFTGAEIKEVCKELSKGLMQKYLGFEKDDMIEPSMVQDKPHRLKKTPNQLINSALKNNISSKKRAEAPMEHKKPLDVTSRAYTAWFLWWKSHLSLDDFLRYLTTQELDYLAVVFQLLDNETKKDSEEDKRKALQQQRDEKKRARTEKIEALKRMKQEYVMGVWNVNSVLLGGLWKDPVLEEENSPDEEDASVEIQFLEKNVVDQEQRDAPLQVDSDQLMARLERIWAVLCLPDRLRLDMAIKYSSQAYRDQQEKAIVAWEQAARLIQQREMVLSKLELFEWEASDPNRFFHPGYPGTSNARMSESKQREEMNTQITSLERDLSKIISEISDCFRDTVTYKGRPYREKMRWDRTEMLYWLQQERRVQSLERVVTRKGLLPTRLAPLELAHTHPTPQTCSSPKDQMLYREKLQPSPSISHIQLCVSKLKLSSVTK